MINKIGAVNKPPGLFKNTAFSIHRVIGFTPPRRFDIVVAAMGMPQREKAFITKPLSALILISLLAALIYSNTFSASFHFDDNHSIVENPRIRNLANFLDFSGSRHVGYLSFALNYRFGGLSVFGYHLVNLLIHIINGFLVYYLVLLLFRIPTLNSKLSTQNSKPVSAPWIALTTALLFVAHPIQTQAVTYIVQRFASLAALFYLLAVVCYLRWRLTAFSTQNSKPKTQNWHWYAGALLSTVLAMKTKENSFTLPLMLVLIEAVFFRPIATRRWIALTPFLATLLIIPFSRIDAVGEAEGGFAQETTEISRGSYLLTQFRVMMTYLRLILLPIHQNLDYDYPLYHSLSAPPVFFSLLFLLSIFILAVYLLLGSRFTTHNAQLISFGILWFFITLSVESSVIPIRDVIFEHRVYLPSAGIFLAVLVGIQKGLDQLEIRNVTIRYVFVLVLAALSMAAYQRNGIWKDEAGLWQDVVRKAPGKARAHINIGLGYYEAHRLEDAVREYQTALKLKPDYFEAHDNLGAAYRNLGRLDDALREHQIALKLQPNDAKVHNNLGAVYKDLGRLDDAMKEYQIALQLRPENAKAHNNLGVVYKDLGRLDDAIQEFQITLQLQPNLAITYYSLGDAYRRKGDINQAVIAFNRALQIKPDFLAAQKALESLPKQK